MCIVQGRAIRRKANSGDKADETATKAWFKKNGAPMPGKYPDGSSLTLVEKTYGKSGITKTSFN